MFFKRRFKEFKKRHRSLEADVQALVTSLGTPKYFERMEQMPIIGADEA